MITNIFTIFDTKAKIYNKPFHQLNDDVCTRSCQDLINNPASDAAMNPADFVCYKLGSYDDETASYDLLPAPELFIQFIQLTPTKLEISE